MKVHLFVIAGIVVPCSMAITGCTRQPASGSGSDSLTAAPDHGAGANHPAHASEELDPISVTLFKPKVELFIEFPHLIQGKKATFLAHLTVLATGEPVRSGTLVLEARSGDGKSVRVQV
ncbi:MAG: hypothetical protein AAB363_08970, partial [Planctomycetota bacterium]